MSKGLNHMSNWFDEDKNNSPENNSAVGADSFSNTGAGTENPEASSTGASNAAGADTNVPNAAAAPVSGGWYTNPASTPASVNSWNTQNGGAPSSVSAAGTESTTYHYGANASNPVPNSTNDYTTPRPQPQSTGAPQTPYSGGYQTQNSYQPQGSYDPYGWRTPVQPGQHPGINPQQPPKPPKKKMSGSKIAIITLSSVCAVAIIAMSVLLVMVLNNKGLSQSTGTVSSGSSTSSSSTVAGNSNAPTLEIDSSSSNSTALSTSAIISKNIDSTVVITTYTDASSQGYFKTSSDNLTEAGTASGIIMKSDGYIITNWHVVVDENTKVQYDRVDVTTHDGKTYKGAQVIGADESTDLALIKINATGLKSAEFGDSSKLQLGDKIVTIGNAGGLNWTTTQGIVSGLARDVYDDTGYSIKCLQIDAAINPGNSGGPLLNAAGQVVGINSAKIVASGYEGIGFSIPINEAKTIIDDLSKYGYVKGRVALGVSGKTITQTGYEGFYISAINSDSCLAGTSAQVGDIITGINGTTVTDYSTLRSELAKHKVGDTVTLTLMRVDSRSGAKSNFTVKCTLKESKS